MKVSVIITTYKRPNYLCQAIDSVLNQSFKDFELIIINDDPLGYKTENVILSYGDSRIVYLKNKKNMRGAKCLNIGLKIAKGEYIAILDDDDVWLNKDRLEKQVAFLEKNKDYVIVGISSITVDSKSNKEISRFSGWAEIDDIRNHLFSKIPFAHSSVMYRKNIAIDVGGYSEDLPRAKDIDFYFKIKKYGKFGFIPDCFIKSRETSYEGRDIVKTRHEDLFFCRKVLWRHRKDNPHFLKDYLRTTLKYLIFSILKIFSFPYYLYRIIRYNKEFFLPTLKIPSITRISLELKLIQQLKRVKEGGILLEIGPSPDEMYKRFVPHTKYFSLDIDEKNKPDICCDVTDIKWSSDYFDTVIATEVLEHIFLPEKAVEEIWRVLKPGGICILSTRFIHYYHPGPEDHYRFTWDSLNYIFRKFKKIEIYHHGNRIQSLWHIINYGKIKVILNIFNPLIARIHSKKTRFPLGFIVYAEK